jgi:hypothetical protein
MISGLYPATLSQQSPARSLETLLAELVERFNALPMTDPARGKLAARIRQIEDEIAARLPL